MATKLISALTAGGNTGVFGLPYATTTYDSGSNTFTATVQNSAPFSLEVGAQVVVQFQHPISMSCYLDVNGTGAITLTSNLYVPAKKRGTYLCIYNGGSWIPQCTLPYEWGMTDGSLVYDSDGVGMFTLSKSGVSSSRQSLPDDSWPDYNLTFPQTTGTLIADTTLANGSTAGAVKTTSTVTSTSGYTACPVINGVPYYRDTNTDTDAKTTSANTDSKIYLIGATSQSSSGVTTYSHDTVYVGTGGELAVHNNLSYDPKFVYLSPNGEISICCGGNEVTTISADTIRPGSGGTIPFNTLNTHEDRITSLESQLTGLATALEELHSGS